MQHYWWFLVSLLGALLVSLMLVQGVNSLVFNLGKTEQERKMVVNSTGRKWGTTFTTLVTFGGAFFTPFPLFYSISFGGAYWLWMIILFSFVVQAVSYEFQNKLGNILGVKTFQWCLAINDALGPVLVGGAVTTSFNGSSLSVDKVNITNGMAPVISRRANYSHGLDALLDVWNVVLGLAVLFLVRILGSLYIINNVADNTLRAHSRKHLIYNTGAFLLLFLPFLVRTLLKDGFAYDPATGMISMESMKYLYDLLDIWYLAIILLVGVVLLLFGIVKTALSNTYIKDIWPAGIGVVLVVLVLLLIVGWNNTAYCSSNTNLQSSLTIMSSSSSEFTLHTMAIVSLFIPFVFAYIVYVWHAMDREKITKEEIKHGDTY